MFGCVDCARKHNNVTFCPITPPYLPNIHTHAHRHRFKCKIHLADVTQAEQTSFISLDHLLVTIEPVGTRGRSRWLAEKLSLKVFLRLKTNAVSEMSEITHYSPGPNSSTAGDTHLVPWLNYLQPDGVWSNHTLARDDRANRWAIQYRPMRHRSCL